MGVIRGLVVADRAWRAYYAWRDDAQPGGLRVDKHTVIGWAAQGDHVWPVRVEAQSARGVLVGSESDPDADALLFVGVPGDDWEDQPWADGRVRRILYGEEVDTDAEEG